MRLERFTFLCDKEERRLITVLAYRYKRSQSDAIRYLIHQAARELGLGIIKQVPTQTNEFHNRGDIE